MEFLYICPYWGQETESPKNFIEKVVNAGYNGIEINIASLKNRKQWLQLLTDTRKHIKNFVVIGQMVPEENTTTFKQLYEDTVRRLELITPFNPLFINSHTGKNFFSFEENCKLIQSADDFSKKTGIPVYHETHRGRFSFALHQMRPYLKTFGDIELVGDYSHWCAVSESMLAQQSTTLRYITPFVKHIHARVGFEHGPQLADPFTKANKKYLDRFTLWWKNILNYHKKTKEYFTICTEAGPTPYMPVSPETNEALADQREANIKMMQHLKNSFANL